MINSNPGSAIGIALWVMYQWRAAVLGAALLPWTVMVFGQAMDSVGAGSDSGINPGMRDETQYLLTNGSTLEGFDTTGTVLNSITLRITKSSLVPPNLGDLVLVVAPTQPSATTTNAVFYSRNTGSSKLGAGPGVAWSSGGYPGFGTQTITFSPPLSLTGQRIWIGSVGTKVSDSLTFWVFSTNFTPAALEQLVSRLYIALFGRAPDTEGLNYWVGRLKTGEGVSHLADAMYGVSPARQYYPTGAAPRDVVASFYRNVLGREADSGGLDYWTGKLLAPGATPGSLIAQMIDVVVKYTGTDAAGLKSAQFFGNRAQAALYYVIKYGALSTDATQVITNVTDSATTLTAAKARVDVLSGK